MNVPSGYTALDLIGFTDRDDYSSTANYVKNDLVHYNGRVWKCLIDDTTGITPVEGANWTVWIDEAAYLSGLADVTITNPTNGQVIRYNSQSEKWENVGVDSTPASGSANLVQSGGVATQLANKANSEDLARVATSGNYQDLNNLPTLAYVATTGQYSDLLGLPTIPTVNNGTLTLQQNGVNVETFNANDSNNKTANFNVPTKTSNLTNDSNFVSDANYQHITVDSAFSDTSTNPVQNKVVNSLKETLTQQINYNIKNGVKNKAINMLKSGLVGTSSSTVFRTVNPDGSMVYSAGTLKVQDSSNETQLITRPLYLDDGQYIASIGLDSAVTGIQFCVLGWTGSAWQYLIGYTTHGVQTFTASSTYEYYSFQMKIAHNTTFANAVAIKPMVCLKSLYDIDPSWEGNAKSNEKLTEDTTGLIDNQNVNGAVNMLENVSSTSLVQGVNFTVNSDKTITVNRTTSGTSTAFFNINTSLATKLKAGVAYRLTGYPKGGVLGKQRLVIQYTSNGSSSSLQDIGDGAVFTLPSGATDVKVYLAITTDSSPSNIVIKPMISLASLNLSYDDYAPYAKSNKELTDLWDTNKYVEYDVTGGETVWFDFTNATRKLLVNTFTRHCFLTIQNVTTLQALSVGMVRGVSSLPYSDLYKPPYNAYGIGRIIKDGTLYSKVIFSKNNINNAIAMVAYESIPAGAEISFNIEWMY